MNDGLLMAGIEARIDATAAITAIVGTARYFQQAPENVGPSYIVYDFISHETDRQFDASDIIRRRIQITSYDRSSRTNPATINALAAAVFSAFERQTLTVVGFNSISVLHDSSQELKVENVWQFSHDFIVELQPV